mmetsp:Transcript_39601/g.84599  ORF Transcript_39601/g.84599 Transcript_39601/m.84599 type:complete len:325 (-) Transcript_39601:414-1388(-)
MARLALIILALASVRSAHANPVKLTSSTSSSSSTAALRGSAAKTSAAAKLQEESFADAAAAAAAGGGAGAALAAPLSVGQPDVDVDDYDDAVVADVDVDVDDYDQTSAITSMERHVAFWRNRLGTPGFEQGFVETLAVMDAEARRVWEAHVPKSLLSSTSENLDDWLNFNDNITNTSLSSSNNSSNTSNANSNANSSSLFEEPGAAKQWWGKVFANDHATASFAIWLLAMTAEHRADWEAHISALLARREGVEAWAPTWQPVLAKTMAQLSALSDPDSDLELRLREAAEAEFEGLSSEGQSINSVALLASRWWLQDSWRSTDEQ